MTLLDRHKPRSLKDIIYASDDLRDRLLGYANGSRTNDLVLFGPFGTGKSTIAELIASARIRATGSPNKPHIINGAQWSKSSIEPIENDWSMRLNEGVRFPIAIIDEVDRLTRGQQIFLRSFLDDPIRPGRFILTTNHLHSLDGGLRNRCDEVFVPMPPPERMVSRLQHILQVEGVHVSDDAVLRLIAAANGSMRDVGRALEDLILRRRTGT